MSLRETRAQLTDIIKEHEALKSQLAIDQKTKLENYSEEERHAHLRDLGQKTVNYNSLMFTVKS